MATLVACNTCTHWTKIDVANPGRCSSGTTNVIMSGDELSSCFRYRPKAPSTVDLREVLAELKELRELREQLDQIQTRVLAIPDKDGLTYTMTKLTKANLYGCRDQSDANEVVEIAVVDVPYPG